jgi:peptidoglycan/xylan/chitin deacetylase (PgdA/CDA1 family)
MCVIGLSLVGTPAREHSSGDVEVKRNGALFYVDTHDHFRHNFPRRKNAPLSEEYFSYFQEEGAREASGVKHAIITLDSSWVEPANGHLLLDSLKRNKIRATFFVAGPFIFTNKTTNQLLGTQGSYRIMQTHANSTHPDKLSRSALAYRSLYKRMIDEGHEFANHSTTHPRHKQLVYNLKEGRLLRERMYRVPRKRVAPDDLTDEQIARLKDLWHWELQEVEKGWKFVVNEIYKDTGEIPENAFFKPYWRAPFGSYDRISLEAAAESGYPFHFGWDTDTLDTIGWRDCNRLKKGEKSRKCWNSQKMSARVLKSAAASDFDADIMVIIGHLSNPYQWGAPRDGQSNDFDDMVKTMRARGYTFVSLSQALDANRYPIKSASNLEAQ